MMSFRSIVKISSQGRSSASGKLDSNIRQIPITAAPAPSLRHAGEARKAGKSGTLPLPAEMGWRRTVATIRMQLQVFAVICEGAHGFSRFGQHSHSSRRGSGDGRHSVEPARAALRRAAAAGVPADRHAGRRFRPGPDAVRRRAHHLSGGLGGAGADPVRRRPANAVSKHPRGAGAVDGAGHHRRAADGADHGAGRQICARSELDRRRCWSAPWWPRPMPRRCFCWCMRRACGCVPASARRWKPNPAPTIRSRCFSR